MTKQKHLIALDLDGTLLTDKKEIMPDTKEVLARLIEQGHIVVIATGRSHRTSIQYYRMLSLTTPIVNFNGAYIHHPKDKKWKAQHEPIAHEVAVKVMDACYDLNVHNIIAKVQDNIYIEKSDEKLLSVFETIQSNDEFSPFKIGHLKKQLSNDPTSLLVFPREEDVPKLKDYLDQEHMELVEHRNWGAPWHITEITKKGINKAVGLRHIAKHFNIPQERIIAFGDEDNDLEMIDYAGIGVAMDNAIDELKSIAKHVTKTNEEEGVRSFLEEYFKLKVVN